MFVLISKDGGGMEKGEGGFATFTKAMVHFPGGF